MLSSHCMHQDDLEPLSFGRNEHIQSRAGVFVGPIIGIIFHCSDLVFFIASCKDLQCSNKSRLREAFLTCMHCWTPSSHCMLKWHLGACLKFTADCVTKAGTAALLIFPQRNIIRCSGGLKQSRERAPSDRHWDGLTSDAC